MSVGLAKTADKVQRKGEPSFGLPHLASRVFGKPLAIARPKLEVILAALGPRLLGVGSTPAKTAEAPTRSRMSVTGDRLAVIQVLGTLVHRAGGMDAMSGLSSYGELAAEFDVALADPSVRGILLEIDSPGGEVAGMFDLAAKIAAARESKPVFAIANELAASAAYLLASAAERVYVTSTAEVGSIGIVAAHVDQSAADAQDGLAFTYLFAGDKKVDGNPHEPLSSRARADVQAQIDELYSRFCDTVAKNRGMKPAAVRSTQAGTFMGDRAVTEGLADKVGTPDQALAELASLSKRRARSGAEAKHHGGEVMDRENDETSIEGKVAKLEGELTAREARIATLEAGLADRDAKIGALTDSVKALQAARDEEKKRAQETYISDLRRTAAEKYRCPIPEQDDPKAQHAPSVAKLRAAFARNDEEGAHALGAAYLMWAEAKGGTARSVALAGGTTITGQQQTTGLTSATAAPGRRLDGALRARFGGKAETK